MVPKLGTIRDLLAGLQKKANIDDETIRNVRIYETHGGKVHRIYHPDSLISAVSEFVALYAEVIPEEERNLTEGEVTISCYHFDKDPNKPHGVPFRFVVKPVSLSLSNHPPASTNLEAQGELFKDTKERLSKRIGLKGKQFEKIKFAIIQRSLYAKPIYLNDG